MRYSLRKLPKIYVDALINLALCTCAGVIIYMLGWNPSFWASLMVSNVIGFTCFFLSMAFSSWFSNRSSFIHVLVPWLIALIPGTLFTFWVLYYLGWTSLYDLASFGKVLLTVFFFGNVIVYFFYSQKQKHLLREALQEAELAQAEKEKALLQSQLKLLQSQIEPHFLFNTLANLKSLIFDDPKRASLLLDKLTALLRQGLDSSRSLDASLQDEVRFCETYLAIQRIRIGDRLDFSIEVGDRVDNQQKIPSILIQPLVENALLHGIEPSEEGGNIIIRITLSESNVLCIEVIDNGIGLSQSNTSRQGVGLANIRDRLNTLYGEKASLKIYENNDRGVTSLIKIPNYGG